MELLFWYFLVFISATAGSFMAIFGFMRKQRKINEALAHYVAADLKQTWQKSAEELVIAIRGKNALDNSDP